ncbi:hypothetical protein TNCV_1728901 [Trichonephila clavipes]|nr:hypothetical protein TNCV_1728901 [Trichonephila clavipes]
MQQQGHELAEKPLSTYVGVLLIPSNKPVRRPWPIFLNSMAKNTTPGPPPKEPKRKGSKDVPQVSSVEKLEERRASLPLAQLVGSEERFFELVERGDTGSVETFLNVRETVDLVVKIRV